MTTIIALFASARRHGNTGKLMDAVTAMLAFEVVDLGAKNLSSFDYEHNNRGDDFEPLMEHVLGFDRIIFASPVYWYSVSVPMKMFLDRISDYLDLPELLAAGRKLRGKTGYVLCTSVYDQPDATFIKAWQQTFSYLGMHYGGCLHANCKDGFVPEQVAHNVSAFVQLLQQTTVSD